ATPIKTGATIYNAVKKKRYPEDYPGFMEDQFDRQNGLPGMGGAWGNNLFMDDDVNILDYGEAVEALATQTNPVRDVIRTGKMFPSPTLFCSWMEEEDREKFMGPGTILSDKLNTDATTKEEPPLGVRRMQFETLYPERLQKWVVDNWQRLGFEEEARWNNTWLQADF
ncbi:MAG: hypothetical protein U1D67_00800, partial [Dehalococcoidia bacterium]|nr:hypothetical protein [Dehalococcoidia bacterium]